jgi:hypothetical protein
VITSTVPPAESTWVVSWSVLTGIFCKTLGSHAALPAPHLFDLHSHWLLMMCVQPHKGAGCMQQGHSLPVLSGSQWCAPPPSHLPSGHGHGSLTAPEGKCNASATEVKPPAESSDLLCQHCACKVPRVSYCTFMLLTGHRRQALTTILEKNSPPRATASVMMTELAAVLRCKDLPS